MTRSPALTTPVCPQAGDIKMTTILHYSNVLMAQHEVPFKYILVSMGLFESRTTTPTFLSCLIFFQIYLILDFLMYFKIQFGKDFREQMNYCFVNEKSETQRMKLSVQRFTHIYESQKREYGL